MDKKEKLLKGLNFLALSFPFIFGGPTLYYYKGAQAIKNNEPWWLVISLVIMMLAVYLAVKGLRKILNAFFDS
ncbi:MAG: DUF6095 family protein [Schleiferiaceae bacterium]|jgi:undecaprenyl pyrophosphate phosphatase UppP|nr:DUF6095 family protein [Schleiferiaceae bacterium]